MKTLIDITNFVIKPYNIFPSTTYIHGLKSHNSCYRLCRSYSRSKKFLKIKVHDSFTIKNTNIKVS